MQTSNNISFSGIKNIGSAFARNENTECRKLILELTNNDMKDLDAAKELFQKFPHPLQDGFAKIDLVSFVDHSGKTSDVMMLNEKELNPERISDVNAFAKIAQWTRKILSNLEISNTLGLPYPFEVEEEYLKSPVCLRNFDIESTSKLLAGAEHHNANSFLSTITKIKETAEQAVKEYFSK